MSDKEPRVYSPVDNLADYQSVFSTESGQKVLHDLMKAHYFFNDEYSGDPNLIVYKAGARGVITRILKLMNMDAMQLQHFLKEREREARHYE